MTPLLDALLVFLHKISSCKCMSVQHIAYTEYIPLVKQKKPLLAIDTRNQIKPVECRMNIITQLALIVLKQLTIHSTNVSSFHVPLLISCTRAVLSIGTDQSFGGYGKSFFQLY